MRSQRERQPATGKHLGSTHAAALKLSLEKDESEYDAVLAPFIEASVRPSDARWREITGRRTTQIRKQWLKRMLTAPFGPRHIRTPETVRRYYQRWKKWELRTFDPYEASFRLACFWRGQHLIIRGNGVRRVILLRMMRLIAELRPKRVCEVGFGNGLNLLILAARFPEIEFAGAELTDEGVAAARGVTALSTLPAGVIKLSPERLPDLAAHGRIRFEQGNAAALPFEDGEFDLVYTAGAVEQMESIRDEALREIARVSCGWASFIEPFRDVNKSGLQRAYVVGQDYFQGRIRDLSDYGLDPVMVSDNLLQNFYMNYAHVVAVRR
jgi:SAM-dependent methyltransferase